jgi:micrococcal nuclease
VRRVLPFLLLVVLAAGYGYGRVEDDGGGASSAGGGTQAARVVRVVDGDTILVALPGGAQERVRYIGVDTPETVKPGAAVECFGKRASARNHRLVEGREVRLVADREARDRYGRRLAYVFRASDGVFVNAELVRGGYATPLRITPNVRYAARFAALAAEARDAGRGLWKACAR